MIWTRPQRPSSRWPMSRQQGQSHRPDRPRRRIARQRRQRGIRAAAANCRCRRCWKRGRCSMATGSSASCTARSRSHIYLARRYRNRRRRHHQDPFDRPARRSRLSEAVHDGGVGGAADRQPACAEALPAVAQAQLPLCGDRVHRRADADAMDDRQSEAGAGNRARHRRADRQRPARVPPQGDAAPGPPARQHHDRRNRNREDHRFRLDQDHRRRRGRAFRQPQ